jgi:DNA-binding HxlR family transcriptional regulator
MSDAGIYSQFCPVARAAEIVASRWTPLVLRELLAGSTRFSELRKGLARMSPSLLVQRLRELEEAGIIRKEKQEGVRSASYVVTEIGRELTPFVMALGTWGQRYVIHELAEHELDPGLLMWDVRRRLDLTAFPARGRFLAEFTIRDAPTTRRTWWILVEERSAELCTRHPGYDVDLSVQADLRTMVDVWRGYLPVGTATSLEVMKLEGEAKHARSFARWFLLSPFAPFTPVTKVRPAAEREARLRKPTRSKA